MASLIGAHLQTARVARELSLLDAAHETRIPVQRLQWLEQDNYAAFGSLTYARAFLKIYSAYLQVDARELLAELPTGKLAGPASYRHLMQNYGPWVIQNRRLARQLTALAKKPHRAPLMTGIAMFALCLIGLGIWGHYVATRQQPDLPLSAKTEAEPETELVSAGQPASVPSLSNLSSLPNKRAKASAFQTGIPAILR